MLFIIYRMYNILDIIFKYFKILSIGVRNILEDCKSEWYRLNVIFWLRITILIKDKAYCMPLICYFLL